MGGERVVLRVDDSNQVTIHRFGATVISWVRDGKEVLFLSENAVFDNKKAIRGGIPVVFPNFGPWELGPQHGFARISMWSVESQSDAEVTLALTDSAATRAMWDHEFKLSYTVSLSREDGLICQLSVKNTGQSSFDFTTLLHTYLRVSSVGDTTVSNLHGLHYTDKLKKAELIEEREMVTVIQGADSVYKATPDSHVITDSSTGHKVKVSKTGLPDTVVWNPWVENAKKMSDFGDEEYHLMICVEPGAVTERLNLEPGAEISFKQNLQVVSD